MKDFLPTTYTFTPGTSGVGTVILDIPNFDLSCRDYSGTG
jgi:hypothetical protein